MNRRRIEELVDQGYIAKKTKGSLSLYNYTNKTQYEGFWVEETLMCRGLILDSDDSVVARSFNKIFNWGEGGRTTDAALTGVTEKVDGSLIIGFEREGEWMFTTRGSFDSEQALWATDYFARHKRHIAAIPNETYLFETIYPGNRIVVDYGDMEALVLLAMRRSSDGVYYPLYREWAKAYGFGLPVEYTFSTTDDIAAFCAMLDSNREGFVAEFADGQRFKFKGAAYVELHRIISGLTYSRAVEAVASGSAEQVREIVPEELREQWDEWVYDIGKRSHEVEMEVERAFLDAEKATRKDYALWVQENVPHLAPYMFLRLDKRDYRPLIFRREFTDG